MKYFFSLIFFVQLLVVSAQLPDDFSDQVVSADWDLPMGMQFDETGRMFVWEKGGKVFIVDTDGNRLPDPLIDISEEVGNWRDHGLLGFTLDPDFVNNGYFYLLYAVERHHLLYYGTPNYSPDSTSLYQASIGRLTRYTADPVTNFQTSIPDSRKVLLGESISTGLPLYHESHGIGTILFGEDGTLLLSCGDGNSNQGADIGGDEYGSYATQALADGIIGEDEDIGSLKSQYLGSLSGKVLRLDPSTGDGIPSNPFYDPSNPRAAQSRIWVYGFRNPFKMTLIENTGSHNPEDADPGTLYIGDVGASQWEELNIAERGGLNFGWPFKEGLIPFWGFWNAEDVPNQLAPNPLYEQGNCEQAFFNFKDLFAEARADGQAFFANPCNQATPIPESVFPRMETVPTLTWGHNEYNLPTKTYIPTYNADGQLMPIDISLAASPIESDIFDGNSSIAGTYYHGDNFPEAYQGVYFHADYSGWIKVLHFDENNTLKKIEPFHDNAKQIIQLIEHPIDHCLYYVSFRDGGSIRKICYGGNPPPIALAKANTIYGPSPLTVDFDASDSYDPFGLPITYHWDFGDETESTASNPTHDFVANTDAPTPFTVTLTVTDSLGLSATNELIISVNNTPPQVEISNPKDGSFYSMNGNTVYRLEANVIDSEHTEDELNYEWQTFLHHNSHNHPEVPSNEVNPQTVITPVGCEADATYWFRIKLTVTDAAGLYTVQESEVFPYCGDVFFELVDLAGVANDQSVDLSWTIMTEDQVEQYEIQRSPFFETIGTVPSTGVGNYQFTDNAPILGDNFYRIKAVRADGLFDYSNSVKVKFPPQPDFNIYPNPTDDLLTIELKTIQSEAVSFELFDALGKSVSYVKWPTTPGNSFKESILTRQLAQGVFFFRLKDGNTLQEGKIMILRD